MSEKGKAGLYGGCAAIICLAFMVWSPFKNLTWDEPHIFYRYAKNFASGYGLVFNHDEKVLGFTSPLYQFMLGFCALLTDKLPLCGNVIFVLSLAALGVTIFAALRLFDLDFLGFIIALGLIIWPAPYNIMGMETLTLALLVFLSFYFFLCDSFGIATVLIGIAILARFDAVVAAVVLLLSYIVKNRRFPWRYLIIGTLILLPWFIFSISYYEVVLPQTFYAKKGVLTVRAFLSGPLYHHVVPFNSDIDYNFPQWMVVAAGIILPAAGMIMGVPANRFFALVFFYMIGIAAGYVLLGRVEDPWPIFPVSLGMRLFMFYAVHRIAVCCSRIRGLRGPPAAWYRLILVVLIMPVFIGDFYLLREKPDSDYIKYLFISRMRAYEEAGKWLRMNASPGSKVYAPEVGTLAYHSGCIFFDYYGLVTRRGWNVPWDKVGEKLRPDYVVIPDGYLGQGADSPPGYSVVKVFKALTYPPVRISKRVDGISGRDE